MHIQINEQAVELIVTFDVRWRIQLEPGIWIAQHRGQDVSITTVAGTLIDNRMQFAFPKGVSRRTNGAWTAQERILVDVLPDNPTKAWRAIQTDVRSALEDAYLLSRHELPEQLGES